MFLFFSLSLIKFILSSMKRYVISVISLQNNYTKKRSSHEIMTNLAAKVIRFYELFRENGVVEKCWDEKEV